MPAVVSPWARRCAQRCRVNCIVTAKSPRYSQQKTYEKDQNADTSDNNLGKAAHDHDGAATRLALVHVILKQFVPGLSIAIISWEQLRFAVRDSFLTFVAIDQCHRLLTQPQVSGA